MQIVIDIPEEDYKVLEKWFSLENLNGTLEQRLFCAVANGTILPKGHGDLIDRNTITVEEDVYFQNYIIHAPTIIGADKETENENSN